MTFFNFMFMFLFERKFKKQQLEEYGIMGSTWKIKGGPLFVEDSLAKSITKIRLFT